MTAFGGDTLTFSGDFSAEIARVEAFGGQLKSAIDGAKGDLASLRTHWQDKDSEGTITTWETALDEISSKIDKAIGDMSSSLSSLADHFNSGVM